MENGISEPMYEFIKAGNEKLAEDLKAANDKEASKKAFLDQQHAIKTKLALELLPEEVKPYAFVSENNLCINIPGCAFIKKRLNIQYSETNREWNIGEVKSVSFITRTFDNDHLFRFYQQKAFEGEVQLSKVNPPQETDDLARAVAMAAEVGDGSHEAHIEAERQRGEMMRKNAEFSHSSPEKLCPLRPDNHSETSFFFCVKDKCALWIDCRQACALTGLADISRD